MTLLMRVMQAPRRTRRRHAALSTLPIHSEDAFDAILMHERARSERSGIAFSLLRFHTDDPDRGGETLQHLAMQLITGLRETDQAGWLDGGRLGAVLPYTPTSGAWIVAERMLDSLPSDLPRPQCDVMVYPSSDMNGRPGNDRRHDDAHRGPGTPATDASEQRQPQTAGESSSSVHYCSSGRASTSMQAQFVRPMPRWKRLVDVIVAATALIILSPLLCLLAVLVKVTSPGPAMFRQRRTGLGGEVFEILKFRTMVTDAEHQQAALRSANEVDGPAFKMKHDPRITPIGRWLRLTSLDELPQLWNVLRGDMSLVGPRPLPCHEADACNAWQRRRLDVTPGITCIWQVSGRSLVKFDTWMRMDIDYIQRRSPWQDFKLLVLSFWAVASCRGAR